MPNTKKCYILDTSILLHNASSFRSFEDNDVVIPYVVLEELDKFKTRDDAVGANARQVARELNKLRLTGPLSEGVQINPQGGTLRVELNFHEEEHPHLNPQKNDDRILNVCLGLAKGEAVVLVTRDINLSVRADVFGVTVEDFDSDKAVNSVSDLYTGTLELEIDEDIIDAIYAGDDIYGEDFTELEIFPNQYMTLKSNLGSGKSALVKVKSATHPLVLLKAPRDTWGIYPKNREQLFAMDALKDPNVKLITLCGAAGTGKTLCSLACALDAVQETREYNRLIVSRPVQPLGKDLGFLPGTVEEKLDPWMGPIKDSIDFLMGNQSYKGRNMYDEMISMNTLEVSPLTYIRGRSIPNVIFLVDEAQDLSRPELKTIVSRMGENSKLILIGDVMQITNPYLDSINNGLSNVIEKFKPYSFSAHISLSKGERSTLASVAAEIL